jgi:hypothetical protein
MNPSDDAPYIECQRRNIVKGLLAMTANLFWGRCKGKEGFKAIMTNRWKMVSMTAITPADR